MDRIPILTSDDSIRALSGRVKGCSHAECLFDGRMVLNW